ncbi:MAG: hypothetical protein Q8K59_12165 [Nitrosomonas sp.]|nr:hypothetical protein [Nitrosomonas sp.]MDP1951819.1 hypothetical protein [Nitrosomonas sp.]
MNNPFFQHPMLASPYDYPGRHWALSACGRLSETAATLKFVTLIPKPGRRGGMVAQAQLSTKKPGQHSIVTHQGVSINPNLGGLR